MTNLSLKLFSFAIVAAAILPSCKQGASKDEKMAYPKTKKVDTITDFFGTKVADPYRWLENDTAADVAEWVKEENKLTQSYLDSIPFRSKIRSRIEEIWNYEKYSAPFKQGDYYFFYKNDGLQNQSVLYFQKGMDGTPDIFIDPNTLSADGTVALGGVFFSNDNKYVAVSTQASGSDWQKMEVMEVATKKKLNDELNWVKFSGAAWKGNGFYYSRYDEPVKGKEFSQGNANQKIYYHTVGTPQSADHLVYQDPAHPLRYNGAGVTEDERFLIVSTTEGTHGNEVLVRDLKNAASTLDTVFHGFEHNYNVIENVGEKLLVHTDDGAPKYHLVLVDPKNPGKDHWQKIIPEGEDLLEGVTTGGGKLFASYLHKAATKVVQYDYTGKMEHEIPMPTIGTAGGFSGKKADKELFYVFTSYVYPPTIYKYDVATGKSEVYKKSAVKFNFDDYETKQVSYKSKDGTEVPMFITYKKGVKMDGNNPTLLYGYGGFNISLSPSFSVARMFLLENGFVLAIPSLRGGGEFGEDWHKAGMLEKKQNVFDDFIGAAEYLIKEKYTSSDKLAISGGSNGGLLVGACLTQRPDLYKVALPAVGVLDMLRFHKFTAGFGWVVEYGSADNEADFKYLYKYSPLQNIKDGTKYPATLITTADHDDRVVPAHSFKFAARLQEAQKGSNPILIRIDTKAGHGAGKPTGKLIDEAADIYSFMYKNFGMTY